MWAVISFLGFLAALFPGVIFKGRMVLATEPMATDIIHLHLPLRIFLETWLKKGIFPLWCPLIYCGFPVQAWGEASFCHPVSLIASLILPAPQALSATILLALTAAGLLTMLYAREINLSWPASFLSACSFAFSAYCIQKVQQLDHLLTLCWLGLVFYGWERYFRSGFRQWVALAGAGWALQILGGYPTFWCYTLPAVCAYAAYGLSGKGDRSKSLRFSWISDFVVSVLIFVAVGLSLSAVQWIPTLEMLPWTVRSGGLSYSQAMYPYYGWPQLLNWLTMTFQGDPWKNPMQVEIGFERFWEGASYIGVIPLILALFCSVEGVKRPGRHRFFSALFVVSLALALATLPYKLLWALVPVFRFFRGPSRFLFLAVFSGSLLAGLGLDRLRRKLQFHPSRDRLLTGSLIVLTLADLWSYGFKHTMTVPPSIWLKAPKVADKLRNPLTRAGPLGTDDVFVTLCRRAISKGTLTPADRLRPYLAYKELLGPSTEPTWGLQGSWSYYSEVRLKRLKDLHDHSWLTAVNGKVVLPLETSNVLKLQAIEFLITPGPINDSRCELIETSHPLADGPTVFLYKLAKFLPRAFVVSKRVAARTSEDVIAHILSLNFDPSQMVILEKPSPEGNPAAAGSDINWEKDEPDEIRLQTHMKGDGYLVLSDTYYPGWQATVDGERTKILQANGNFRALWLKKGEHRISFTFKPLSFRIGLMISALSGLMLVFGRLTRFRIHA